MNAQGEDVVAGMRTPVRSGTATIMPKAYEQLRKITDRLEKHYRDMQDFEFTIEEEKLYMLQTRNGKRTGRAAVRIAIDMVNEGLITQGRSDLPRRAQPAVRLPGPAPRRKGREDQSARDRTAGITGRCRRTDRLYRR